jgi:uncharacterized protein (DUF488 family)
VDRLLATVSGRAVAVMCSESVWWRCHRRLLADHLVLVQGCDIEHVMHDGRRVAHPVTAGAHRVGDAVVYRDEDDADGQGRLSWPATGAEPPPPPG